MSRFKSLYNNYSHSYYDINHILSNFNYIYDDIIKKIHDQVFFDDQLNYQQQIYLLNHQSCIEEDFLQMLINYIRNLTLNDDIRQTYIDHINKFSSDLIYINRDSHVDFRHYIIDDDDNNNTDDNDVDLTESENEDCDDLENLLLDEYEIRLYINNNNNNQNINSTSHLREHQFESDFDDHFDN